MGRPSRNKRGDVATFESAVDIHRDDIRRASVEHCQERGQPGERGSIADAGGDRNDRAIDQAADDARQGAVHSCDNDDRIGA